MANTIEELTAARIAHNQKLAPKIKKLHELYHNEETPEALDEFSKEMFQQPSLSIKMQKIHTLYHIGQPEEAEKEVDIIKGFGNIFLKGVDLTWDQKKILINFICTHKDLPDTSDC